MNNLNSLSVLDSNRVNPQREYRRAKTVYYSSKIKPVKFSLGWELEANHGANRVPGGIRIDHDGSVNGDGLEYSVYQTLVMSPEYVLGLLKHLVHSPGLNTDKSCGFHVHLAPQKATSTERKKWAITMQFLGKQIEEEAFKAVPESRQGNRFCRKISLLTHTAKFSPAKYGNDMRYDWVNIVETFRQGGIGTVEIRLLGNTHRWKYLLSWVYFCLALGKGSWIVMQDISKLQEVKKQLTDLLTEIANNVRPLKKRNEPINEQIFLDLKKLGIGQIGEKPLAALVAIEASLKNVYIPAYSDNQPTVQNEEEENICSHGIDVENESCSECDHESGNCEQEWCLFCAESCHSDGEICGLSHCSRCDRLRDEQARAEEEAQNNDRRGIQ